MGTEVHMVMGIHTIGDYSKNPWPLKIRTIPNLVGLVGREPTRPLASWVLGPQDPPHWELCKFPMARGSCYNLHYAQVLVSSQLYSY